MNQLLIFDLDDTIFQTNSINPKIVKPAISILKEYYYSTEVEVGDIISALWSKPIDFVFEKFKTPKSIVSKFYKQVEKIDFKQLKIELFEDYQIVQSIRKRKILVTTGIKELQMAKIRALGIESDFESIKIDDPRFNPRKHKLDIFSEILNTTELTPTEIWVIGDNPDSEIKAGKKLGMNTIQRKSKTKKSSEYADYEIESFNELIQILN